MNLDQVPASQLAEFTDMDLLLLVFQSVLGQRRPNCVIIDEIDGATGGHEAGGAVAALLKIAMAAGGGGGSGSSRGTADAGWWCGGIHCSLVGTDQQVSENEHHVRVYTFFQSADRT